ncbi:MAG: hypothetical protein IPL70_20055 [Uliginosibacterium sp.]|nr:hypothetical protein [Uliginosibacterium sp.]
MLIQRGGPFFWLARLCHCGSRTIRTIAHGIPSDLTDTQPDHATHRSRLAPRHARCLMVSSARASTACEALSREAFRLGSRVDGCRAGRIVTGAGRLPFHTDANRALQDPDLFVVPGDKLIAHAEHQGFTAVLYIHRRRSEAEGWVASHGLPPPAAPVSRPGPERRHRTCWRAIHPAGQRLSHPCGALPWSRYACDHLPRTEMRTRMKQTTRTLAVMAAGWGPRHAGTGGQRRLAIL